MTYQWHMQLVYFRQHNSTDSRISSLPEERKLENIETMAGLLSKWEEEQTKPSVHNYVAAYGDQGLQRILS